ncbi:RING finger protein unkempt-like protein [Sciurus carolinensis]|uniref:RING finger protein unkempt-like protein n=1 Tax=Sciurus carolinensis TaxID=30640 RepID=A0AA41MXH8_SCICA|nr:RING finger protein unkempt-like protein [Sciurus carolinensis]
MSASVAGPRRSRRRPAAPDLPTDGQRSEEPVPIYEFLGPPTGGGGSGSDRNAVCLSRYLKEFRTEQCSLFVRHKCGQHRPFTCFHWHFLNQRRRRPLRRRDGTFNYSPDVYCSKYDEATGLCPDGDECPYLHRTTGDTERKYHLRYYKTGTCIHETDARGHCVKNGLHCAFAHGPLDLRPPVCDIRELQAQEALQNGQPGSGDGMPDLQPGVLASQAMIEKILGEDPRWQDTNFVLGSYKTEQCPKPPRLCRQGYACPHYHSSRDRRRDPRRFQYRSTPCPSVKHGDEWGEPSRCAGGDGCQYCHSRTEQQFHPEIYKSTKCNDMRQTGYCPRGPFCAFAHIETPRPMAASLETSCTLRETLAHPWSVSTHCGWWDPHLQGGLEVSVPCTLCSGAMAAAGALLETSHHSAMKYALHGGLVATAVQPPSGGTAGLLMVTLPSLAGSGAVPLDQAALEPKRRDLLAEGGQKAGEPDSKQVQPEGVVVGAWARRVQQPWAWAAWLIGLCTESHLHPESDSVPALELREQQWAASGDSGQRAGSQAASGPLVSQKAGEGSGSEVSLCDSQVDSVDRDSLDSCPHGPCYGGEGVSSPDPVSRFHAGSSDVTSSHPPAGTVGLLPVAQRDSRVDGGVSDPVVGSGLSDRTPDALASTEWCRCPRDCPPESSSPGESAAQNHLAVFAVVHPLAPSVSSSVASSLASSAGSGSSSPTALPALPARALPPDPTGCTVEAVLGSALDLRLGDVDIASLDKDLEEQDCRDLGLSGSAPVTIPGSLPRSPSLQSSSSLSTSPLSSHSQSLPGPLVSSAMTPPQQPLPLRSEPAVLGSAASSYGSLGLNGVPGSIWDFVSGSFSPSPSPILNTVPTTASSASPNSAELARVRRQLDEAKRKIRQWEESWQQVQQACDAWQREAREAQERARAADSDRQLALRRKEEVEAQVKRLQEELEGLGLSSLPGLRGCGDVGAIPLPKLHSLQSQLRLDLEAVDGVSAGAWPGGCPEGGGEAGWSGS